MEQLATPVRTKKGVTGLIIIHTAPAALRPHIEWALQNVVGTSIPIVWKSQPSAPGTFRSTLSYRDRLGLAPVIATALRSWHYLRFEITECDGEGGELFRFTPELGLHRARIDGAGSIMIDENRIAHALANSFDEESLRECLHKVLGTQWEEELEIFRGVELQEVARLRAI